MRIQITEPKLVHVLFGKPSQARIGNSLLAHSLASPRLDTRPPRQAHFLHGRHTFGKSRNRERETDDPKLASLNYLLVSLLFRWTVAVILN